MAQSLLEGTMIVLLAILGAFGLYHVLTGIGGWRVRRRRRRHAARAQTGEELVTFLVSAYRERDVLFPCLESILAQQHPPEKCRIVLVADEDDEGSLEAIRAWLAPQGMRETRNSEGDEVLETPRVTAILQRGARARRGKPRALQNGMRYVPHEGFIGIMDADHLLAPDFVPRCLEHFADPNLGIVQAKRYPKEAPRSWLARWDILEQNVGQVQSLLARDRIGCASFYGSTALARAPLLHEIGWQNCLAEDTLLNYEVRERGYGVAYEPATGSGEDQVTRLRSFIVQRRRWSAGHMQVFFSKFGRVRRFARDRFARWDGVLALNYYNATLAVLAYWLVRATHYWVQRGSDPLMPAVTLASVAVGCLMWRFESGNGGGHMARVRGLLVGTAIAYGVLSIAVAFAQPPPDPLPVPVAFEVALFFAPLVGIVAGYLNPEVRPHVFRARDHAINALVLVTFAPIMLVTNTYATLTGLLVSIEGPHAAWVKTARNVSRREATSKSPS